MLLLSTLIIIPTLLGIGSITEKFLGMKKCSVSQTAVVGILTITLLFTLVAFFYPINIYLEICILSLGIFSFIKFKKYYDLWSFIKANRIFFPILLVFILFFGSFYPFILDHFGYYVPTILWIKHIGITKGISNLDIVLGQMSLWHIFQAGFSWLSDGYLRINSILLVIFGMHIFEKKDWISLTFLPILFLFSQSPSPDLAVISFSLILLSETLSNNRQYSYLFALSVFIFAIKPTMLWAPLFIFLYLTFAVKTNIKTLLLGLFIGILFCFKNIWTFGFPIFPVQILDLGLSWKPNAKLLKESSEIAILKTYDLQYSLTEIRNFSTLDYISNWLSLKGIKGVINIGFVLSLGIFIIFSWIKQKKIINILCISVIIKSILVLLFSAQYRFFIDIFFLITFVMLYQKVSFRNASLLFISLSIIIGVFLSFPKLLQQYIPSFNLGYFMKGFTSKQFIKPSYYKLNQYHTERVGNLTFNFSQNYPFSFDTPPPAISSGALVEYYNAKIFPQKISNNLKDGIIWKKLNDEELKQLNAILTKYKLKNQY